MLSAIKMDVKKKKKLTPNVDKGSSVTMQKLHMHTHTRTHARTHTHTHTHTLYILIGVTDKKITYYLTD